MRSSLFVIAVALSAACGKSADDAPGGPQGPAAGTSGGGGSSAAQGAGGHGGNPANPDAAEPTTGGAGGAAGGAAGNGFSGTGGAAGASGTAGAGSDATDGSPPPVDAGASSAPLRIYWIDAEGGAATVIATPTGQTLVVDTGWSSGDRDANRIAAVLKNEIHASKIDYLVTTHYHIDHLGISALAALFPVGTFLDHGATVEPSADFDRYQAAVAGKTRTSVKPGDNLTFGNLRITFVTAAGEVIDPPLPEATANPNCAGAVMKSDIAGPENPMSVGLVARFGSFDFVDFGDLTWNIEQKLVCPINRIGPVDVYQVNHHGMDISSSPQLVYALAPTVAVMDNGSAKGGSPAAFDVIRASPGLKDLWSLHRVLANDAQHNAADDLTANTTGMDLAYGIKAVVERDGTYTLTNARNGVSRTYASR